jgi:hypothetical protein
MSSDKRLSEVSLAYNKHVVNLDRARKVFEEEMQNLVDFAHKHLDDRRTWPQEGVRKVRWGKPQPTSSARSVPWLNWVAGTKVRMDIRPPNFKVFRKAAAFVYFEIVFVRDIGNFVFECRLENQNIIDTDLDEETFAVIQKHDSSEFPRAEHIKRDTTVIYRCDIEESLFDDINNCVNRGLDVICEAVNQIFPDSEYTDTSAIEEEKEQDEIESQEQGSDSDDV